jgi:hypothetical protein
MSLKPYDLLWVEGKSAAWRYPGEIAELISFAPPVPEQPYDRFYKKTSSEITANSAKDAPEIKPSIQEAAVVHAKHENRSPVYINLPAAEKHLPGYASVVPVHEPIDLDWDEPRAAGSVKIRSLKKSPGRKWLLTGSVVVFFIAGMLTGFYLSNRRNFYSKVGNTPQYIKSHTLAPAFPQQNKFLSDREESKTGNSKKSATLPQGSTPAVSRSKKKLLINSSEKKDSAHASPPVVAVQSNVTDSSRSRQETADKLHALAARVIAHPGEYLLISTGNYKTGLFGGISETPVSLTNRSGVTMDLVVVAIDYIQHNKKIFKTENLSFHNVVPGATVIAEAPKSPRGVKIGWRLTVANAQQIGMAYSHFK